MANPLHFQVAIIGAGFCGTMVAVNIARQAPGISVALIDQHAAGPGLAYGTTDPDHLLNVRAGQMGAFADDPRHFWRWLQSRREIHPAAPLSDQNFAPRQIYGRYLQEILDEACTSGPNLKIFQHRITNLRRLPDKAFEIVADDGQKMTADRVVLALGNFPPDPISHSADLLNPYAETTWQKLASHGDVLIVGTGLTSLDLVVTLAKTKADGVIHLLSRHGLLPREHADAVPYKLKLQPPYPVIALGLLMAVRKEVAQAKSIPWQSVIDALRPHNQGLWQSMNLQEQRRFLRHLRSYWDVHRHRCAPQVMDAYRALERQGRIVLHHGSIIQQTICGKGWNVIWRPRGKSASENLTVQHIVRCTGPQADFRKLDDTLVQNLIAENLIVPDNLHLGIASTDSYIACDAAGNAITGLYALGSLLKGRLYESVAVPELRKQAADIAHILIKDMI